MKKLIGIIAVALMGLGLVVGGAPAAQAKVSNVIATNQGKICNGWTTKVGVVIENIGQNPRYAEWRAVLTNGNVVESGTDFIGAQNQKLVEAIWASNKDLNFKVWEINDHGDRLGKVYDRNYTACP